MPADAPVLDAWTRPEARLPADDAPSFPSLARADGTADVALFADVALCTQCHEGAAATHASSAHARSSFDNPWYRTVVDRVRDEVGFAASRHCAGCHDPLLLASGAMERPIAPEDPLARAGVTCLVCHSVRSATADGNASYVLDTSPVPIPDPNVPEEIAAHRARVALPPLRTPALCASCHRGFLSESTGNATFFPGIDEAGPWRASPYDGQLAQRLDAALERRACIDCHVEPFSAPADLASDADGFVASHRFAGGHSALAAAAHDDGWLDAVRRRTSGIATIDVAALVHEDGTRALPADGADVGPGEQVTFDVVVRNVGVGHRFPGGIRDVRDHFVVVRVRDATGRILAEGGAEHEAGRDDDATFALRTAVLRDDGTIEPEHFVPAFRALGWDHTVAPRDAIAVRYAVRLPDDAVMPLSVEASLRARRHDPAFSAAVCAEGRSERARGFDASALAAGRAVLDGCAPEPVLTLAETTAVLGGEALAADRPTFERLYDHALALSHDGAERLDDARPSIDAALAIAPDDAARARILVVLASIEGAEGRTEAALARADEAEALVGPSPAIDRVRGRALAHVWRRSEAATYFTRVAASAPFDVDSWRDLARASASAGDPAATLTAAVSGLALLPRDETLLRTQMLALEALGDPAAPGARAAFLAYRRPDAELALRLRCDATLPHCERDRQPLVVIELSTRGGGR